MSKKSLMMAFTCFVTLLSGFSSCTTEDKADEALPRLQVSQARYEVTLPGTLKDRSIPEMRVIANKGYQISSDKPWLKVDKTERSEEHTSELQSRQYLVCRLLLEKTKAHDHK